MWDKGMKIAFMQLYYLNLLYEKYSSDLFVITYTMLYAFWRTYAE